MGITYNELNDFPGKVFECSCGHPHSMDIDRIVIESGALQRVAAYLKPYQAKKIFLIADNNTYAVAVETVERLLRESGSAVVCHIFTCEGQLIPNEKALADLVLAIPCLLYTSRCV